MIDNICQSICWYDDNNVCLGCGRIAEEIVEWMIASDERKIEIKKLAEERVNVRRAIDIQEYTRKRGVCEKSNTVPKERILSRQ